MGLFIGNKVRTLRENNNMSVEYLANKLNIRKEDLMNIESDKAVLTTDILFGLIEIFNISGEEFLFNEVENLKHRTDMYLKEIEKNLFLDPKQYIDSVKKQINLHPGIISLKLALINAYCYCLRDCKNEKYAKEIILISKELEKALETYKETYNIHIAMSIAYFSLGDIENGKKSLEKILPDSVSKEECAAICLCGEEKLLFSNRVIDTGFRKYSVGVIEKCKSLFELGRYTEIVALCDKKLLYVVALFEGDVSDEEIRDFEVRLTILKTIARKKAGNDIDIFEVLDSLSKKYDKFDIGVYNDFVRLLLCET